MEKKIKWFNLSRFGAALRVIPNSPLRGVAMTCFEISDRDLYQKMYSKDDAFNEDIKARNDAWFQAKSDLGFSENGHTIYDANSHPIIRFYSYKTEFSLSELKRLAPDLNASDLIEMPVSDIALTINPTAELSDQWAVFSKDILSKEAIAVWTPKVNPYALPFAKSSPITDASPVTKKEPFALLGSNQVALFYGMGDKLHRAGYRENALIPFYVDVESAKEDGWDQADLYQVDMPYAAPLWITKAGKIIALRDVRFAPEIMEHGPEQYYHRLGKGGIIVQAIRESKKVGVEITPEIERWKAWGKEPESLIEPDLMWASIAHVVSVIGELKQRHPRLPSDIKHLTTDGKDDNLRKELRAKPLIDMTAADIRLLVLEASRYVLMADEQRGELVDGLDRALKRGHGLMASNATELAKQKLQELSEAVQSDAIAEVSDSKFKHVDTGEKIGGARKDYARRSMTVDDLESMNDMERKTHVMKKNVWASLDYEQMREDGIPPQVAIAIKYLKDKLNTAPDRRDRTGYSADEADSEYIHAISLVRDVMSDVKTLEAFGKALGKLYEVGTRLSDGERTNYLSGGTPNQIQWGRDAALLIFDGNEGNTPFKIRKEIYRKVESWGDGATVAQQWSSLIKPKREKSESEVDAEKIKSEQDRELHRPHLDNVQRDGRDWRGGRDITADDLIENFGFRAVEFGNWLPQDERQQVLNMSFDSMCDLADALDIPPKGLSFDGDLAVAFGSRGRGGKHAALAHFEPARNVINLTRMNGAGALAHEWMHGLDFYLGGKSGYSSEQNEGGQGVMANLSRAMKRRPSTEDEIYTRASDHAARGKEYTLSWLYGQGPDTKQDLAAVLSTLIEKAKAVFLESSIQKMEMIRDNKDGKRNFDTQGSILPSTTIDLQDEMFVALRGGSSNKPGFTKVKDKVEANLRYMVHNLAVVCTIEASRDMKVDLPASFLGGAHATDTNFHAQAKALDKTRSDPYWATTRELFARAGAAFVSDQIEAKEARSDYLVYGSDENRYANHPVGNPNPAGNDRQVLANHFHALISEYRLQCARRAELDVCVEP